MRPVMWTLLMTAWCPWSNNIPRRQPCSDLFVVFRRSRAPSRPHVELLCQAPHGLPAVSASLQRLRSAAKALMLRARTAARCPYQCPRVWVLAHRVPVGLPTCWLLSSPRISSCSTRIRGEVRFMTTPVFGCTCPAAARRRSSRFKHHCQAPP